MPVKHLYDLVYFFDFSLSRIGTPSVKQQSGEKLSYTEQLLEVFPHLPGFAHLIVGIGDGLKVDALSFGKILRVLEQRISAVFQVLVLLHFPSAYLVDGRVEIFDQMKPV